MADQLVRTDEFSQPGTQLQAWQESRPEAPAAAKNPIERPLAAIRRYKWLIVAVIAVAIGGGIAATRFLKPEYEVHASIMISSESPMEERTGPIRSSELLDADDWVQLLKSYSVVDDVVRKLALYLEPADPSDRDLFHGFDLADRVAGFGKYELEINQTKKTWKLSAPSLGTLADSGTMADSVGRVFGFRWQLPRSAFYGGKSVRKVKFTVSTPRETAVKLVARLAARRPGDRSNFLILAYDDPDPALAAQTINIWLKRYIEVAAEQKKRKLVEFTNTLGGQLQTSKASLDSAEDELSGFRINTITEPNETAPIAAGLQQTMDPVMKAYFDLKLEHDDVAQDISSLEKILNAVNKDSIPNDALLQIPSVARGGPGAQALTTAFADYYKQQSDLARARVVYTDENPIVKALVGEVTTLKKDKIPELARALLASLKTKEAELAPRIASSGTNLQKIPERTIEEQKLARRREVAAGMYTNLQNRYAEAQLAEASATPDVMVLDSAIAPLSPTTNTAWRVVAIAIAGGIGAAFALALLLDKLDGRFRYAEQSTDDLGLPIAGTVPLFPKGGVDQRSTEQMFQLVESFRTLRMSILQASPRGVSLAVSSAAPGEGKSLISANLAMSFADAGLKTILVDGDTRRGTLHQMFGLPNAPGLTDQLAGTARTDEVVLPTSNPNLFLVPCGTRLGRSPELLTSPRLREMVSELRGKFDAVIFDTPPLAAGIDGYSIAAAAGSLIVVLRVGQTQRRLAAEKLRMLDRLPVDVVGSVLNGVDFRDGYEFYGYIPGYEAVDEPGTAVAQV